MKDYFYFSQSEVPTKVPVIIFKKMFSDPILYIPKIKGTDKPNINKDWYVSYYYRSPFTSKMEKFIEKRNINRLKTITDRKKAGNNLRQIRLRLLQDGFNPFKEKLEKQEKSATDLDLINKNSFTVSEAFALAFNEKKKTWAESSADASKSLYNVFMAWLKKKKLDTKDIEKLSKRHVVIFLNERNSESSSNSTRNNYHRLISSLMGKMTDDDIIKRNFVKDISLLKEKATKNKPFTKQQLGVIKEYLIENDSYLHSYMCFITYALLRPIEVCRLKVKDIDLENNILHVNTKTESYATVLIIEPLRKKILEMDLSKYNPQDTLFTKYEKPSLWETGKEKSKADFFGRRYRKVKRAIGNSINLEKEHNLYSARHTVALDLFFSFKNQGMTDLEAKHKLMTITRHKSLEGLENYLRDIGASLPDDYSSDYTLNF